MQHDLITLTAQTKLPKIPLAPPSPKSPSKWHVTNRYFRLPTIHRPACPQRFVFDAPSICWNFSIPDRRWNLEAFWSFANADTGYPYILQGGPTIREKVGFRLFSNH
jgi:hypothetical protein